MAAAELTAHRCEIAPSRTRARGRSCRALEARLVELYKLGQRRDTGGCCCRPPTSRQSARHPAWWPALAARSRADPRVSAASWRARTSRQAPRAARSTALATLRADAARAQARGRARRRRPERAIRGDRRRTRPQRAAGGRTPGRPAEPPGHAARAVRGNPATVALPLARFRGELDWPAAGAVRARFRRGSGDRSTASSIAAAEGTPVRAIHERHGGVRRYICGLRQPGHPRPRLAADISAFRRPPARTTAVSGGGRVDGESA